MATKIRRSLFIGLGGTGMNALLHTKKMFVDTYGEVPPMIGFLGIDTDGGEYKKTLVRDNGEEVRLDPSEQFPISVKSPKEIYNTNIDHFSWVPQENVFALTNMTEGAGQVRTNGRFALTVKEHDVSRKISDKVNSITNANIVNNSNYELLSEKVEIHIVFSVCGGTGSGTFINLAYLCRKQCKQAKIVGYAVLADVFESFLFTGVSKIKPNAYAALSDLDFMMHLDGKEKSEIGFDYITHTDTVNSAPFNAVFLIDNKNENGDTYNHIDQLAEMISLALITSTGELSAASASTLDNIEKNIMEGNMDIAGKKAWVSALGVSEIIYSSKELAEIYARKAAKQHIVMLLNSEGDCDKAANAWIDKPEVNIRENNGNDNLIDFMLGKNPKLMLEEITDKENPMPECEQYLARETNIPELANRVQQKTQLTIKQLHDEVVSRVNADAGIGTTISILNSIREQVKIFQDEMEAELDAFKRQDEQQTANLKTACDDLAQAKGKALNFFFKGNIKDAELNVTGVVSRLAVTRREILRRQSAITLFTSLEDALQKELTHVVTLAQNLKNVAESMTKSISKIENNVGRRSQTFQIDLSATQSSNIAVAETDISVPTLIESLSMPNRLYDYATVSSDVIEQALLDYTRNLKGTQELQHTTIDDVINSLPDQQFKQVMNMALTKSKVLLQDAQHGYMQEEPAADCYYIGVANKADSRLKRNDSLREQANVKGNMDFANIGMNDRIILYHQKGVVPLFTIAPIAAYREKYDSSGSTTDNHFDYNIELLMEQQQFDIFPKKEKDGSINFWVYGFILGYIRNNGGHYQVRSDELGDPLDNFWFELGEHRDKAFDLFKAHIKSIKKDFEDKIEKFAKDKGEDAFKAIINDAKENYLEKFSQVNMTTSELKSYGNERIRELISDEITIVKNLDND